MSDNAQSPNVEAGEGKVAVDDSTIESAEHDHGRVSDRNAAEQVIQTLKNELPAVPSAYHPSGKMPPLAMAYLLAGSLIGVPIAAAVGVLAGAVGAIVLLILFKLIATAFTELPKIVRIFMMAATGTGILLAILYCIVIPWALIGMTAAWATATMGKRGKNRSTKAAAFFAALSGLAAVALIQLAPKWFHVNTVVPPAIYWIGIILGSAVVVGGAIYNAGDIVQSAKFCEMCALYMSHGISEALSMEAVRGLAATLRARDLKQALPMLRAHGEKGGTTTVHDCPGCGRGYLEVFVDVVFEWPGGKKQEQWLVGSIELTASDVLAIRAAGAEA